MGVSTDPAGNSYAVGSIYNKGQVDFGGGVIATGKENYGNLLIVEYNSSGVAQWAKTTAGSSSYYSEGRAVSVDSSGNVFAAGQIYDSGQVDLGDGVTLSGLPNADNFIIIKYAGEEIVPVAAPTNQGDDEDLTGISNPVSSVGNAGSTSPAVITTLPATGAKAVRFMKNNLWSVAILSGVFVVLTSVLIIRKKSRSC